MTDEERQYATDHHSLILSFLRSGHLAQSEYYDIAAWGFLRCYMKQSICRGIGAMQMC